MDEIAHRVRVEARDGISTLHMDDGKVNVMSIPMLEALHEVLDGAEARQDVVLLEGRPGIFSAGFDLGTLAQGAQAARTMLRLGATLAERLLSFPRPVVSVCTGHAYPMGAFLLLSSDRRVASEGEFRIGLNEVAIGLTLPHFAVEIARQRLSPAAFQRAVTGDLFGPEAAREAGFVDEVLPAEAVLERGREIALQLTTLDPRAHRETKERLRAQARAALRRAIESELAA